MALIRAQKDIIAIRREWVAKLSLRHLTQREIVAALAAQGLRNPDDGEPWSQPTICGDLKALNKQWAASALAHTDEHKGEVLAELVEVKRQAWADKDMDQVLKALKQECSLLGLDAPTKIAPTDPTGKHEYSRLSDAELDRQIAEAMAAACGGAGRGTGEAATTEALPSGEADADQ